MCRRWGSAGEQGLFSCHNPSNKKKVSELLGSANPLHNMLGKGLPIADKDHMRSIVSDPLGIVCRLTACRLVSRGNRVVVRLKKRIFLCHESKDARATLEGMSVKPNMFLDENTWPSRLFLRRC